MSCVNDLPFNHLNDSEFYLALYELNNGPINFEEDRLTSIKFNPFLPGSDKGLAISNDLDPDSNFYSKSLSCNYYTEYKLNDLLTAPNMKNLCSLSFLHLNIRSLSHNLDKLHNLLANVKTNFSIIGISETWLQSAEHNVNIDGYNFIHNYRSNRSGGGVGFYVAADVEYKIRSDLAYDDINWAESLFIEIDRPHEKNIIIGIVYRPPNQNIDEFVKNTNTLMAKISKLNKTCYLMGDWNLNLMNHISHQLTSEFLDIMYTNMFLPLIYSPYKDNFSFCNSY